MVRGTAGQLAECRAKARFYYYYYYYYLSYGVHRVSAVIDTCFLL